MDIITIEGVSIELDKERTASLYKGPSWDQCQCDGCTNSRVARARFTPPEQVRILSEVGVDPLLPVLSEGSRKKPFDPPKQYRLVSCWLIYGRVLGAVRTPEIKFDQWNWLWADTTRPPVEDWDRRLKAMRFEDSELYVLASNSLPWLYGEVCEFRFERTSNCASCGDLWHITGFLKSRSMIPEWYGVPELHIALRERKGRVFVEICTQCGRLEHTLVTAGPPFRTRNTPYHVAMKRMRKSR